VSAPAADPIRFVIITGLSGAGKSYAIKCLEDLNYFCVDNLPTTLIPTFAELCAQSSRGIPAIALGVDVREGEYLANMVGTLEELRTRGHLVDVLFLEASDESLVRRYHETRRRHPLAGEGSVLDGIRAERKALAHLREMADRIIDTSALTVHQLKDQMVQSYGPRAARGSRWRWSPSASSTAYPTTVISSSTSGSCPTRTSSRSCAPWTAATARSRST
jgi:UPF0042 nucleotide-binding protein